MTFKLLLCAWDVPRSNLDPETSTLTFRVLVFFPVLPGKFQSTTLIWAMLVFFHNLPLHFSLTILLFNTIQYEQLKIKQMNI